MISESNHDGTLESVDSFVSVDSHAVCISAFKKAEKGSAEILRLVELRGEKQTVTLHYFGKCFPLGLNPSEIKTLQITQAGICQVQITEDTE